MPRALDRERTSTNPVQTSMRHLGKDGHMVQLHPALSYCEVDGRYVFLDVPGDRYFSLDGDLDLFWRDLQDGRASSEQISALASHQLIVASGGRPLAPCPDRIPRSSALDLAKQPRSLGEAIAGILKVAKMRRDLRRKTLVDVVTRFAGAKEAARASTAGPEELGTAAAAFLRFDLLTTTLDQCLSRSLALGFHLVHMGFRPELVFGVRLGPFSAHCWIECDGILVNDRFDRAGTYRPIRRI